MSSDSTVHRVVELLHLAFPEEDPDKLSQVAAALNRIIDCEVRVHVDTLHWLYRREVIVQTAEASAHELQRWFGRVTSASKS